VSPSQFFLANVYAERLAGTPIPLATRPESSTARPAAATSGQDRWREETPVTVGTR